MDMDMHHGDRYAPWTWKCSMDMFVQHGRVYAAWTMDMDKDYYWTGTSGCNYVKARFM